MGRTVLISTGNPGETQCFGCGKWGHYRSSKECEKFKEKQNQKGTTKPTTRPQEEKANGGGMMVARGAWTTPLSVMVKEQVTDGGTIAGMRRALTLLIAESKEQNWLVIEE